MKSRALFLENGTSHVISSQKRLTAALLTEKASAPQTEKFNGKLGWIYRTLGNIWFDFDQRAGGKVQTTSGPDAEIK